MYLIIWQHFDNTFQDSSVLVSGLFTACPLCQRQISETLVFGNCDPGKRVTIRQTGELWRDAAKNNPGKSDTLYRACWDYGNEYCV